MIWPSWDLILKDRETGKAVWLVRGKCGWMALITRQILQDEAHCLLLKMRGHKGGTKELSKSLNQNGFRRVSIDKGGKLQWFITGDPPAD